MTRRQGKLKWSAKQPLLLYWRLICVLASLAGVAGAVSLKTHAAAPAETPEPDRAGSGEQQLSSKEPPLSPPSEPATVYRIPIEGMVDLGMAPFVTRVIAEAAAADNGVVLLDKFVDAGFRPAPDRSPKEFQDR